MAWDNQVPGCFGTSDLIFASHKLDEDRAFAWLGDLRARSVGWTDARTQIEAYLASKGAGQEHTMSQIKAAERFMRPWLLD